MGLLNYLGLDELADSINELTTGFDELKEEIVTSVIGPGEELKNTVHEIAGSITSSGTTDSPVVEPPVEESQSN